MRKILTALLSASLLAGSALAVDAGAPADRCKYRHQRIEQALSQLPEAKAALVRDRMQQMKQEKKAQHQQIHALYRQVKELAMAEPFDKEAFLAKKAEIRQLKLQSAQKRDEAMADLATQLTAEERATLIKAFSKGRRGHREKQDRQRGE